MPQVVTILYRSKPLHFIAGRYVERLGGTVGVRLAGEIPKPFDIDMGIKDYGVWDPPVFEEGLQRIIAAELAGQVCYLGCMGGIGRTGTVLAGLYRALSASEEDPIDWVRRVYLPHAVETREQEALVRTYNVTRVRRALDLDPDGITTFEELVAGGLRWLRDPFQTERKRRLKEL